MQDLLFDTHHTLRLLHLCVGNINAECLDIRRPDETGIDCDQRAKGANHKSGADQQDESQRYLEHDERASCPESMAALAHGTSAFPQRGQLRHRRIFESRHATEEQADEQRYNQCEQNGRAIDCDFVYPWKSSRSEEQTSE